MSTDNLTPVTFSVLQAPAPLSGDWLDWLFARMRVQYGQHFDRLWTPPNGASADVAQQFTALLRAEWSQALAGFQADNGRALVYACEHLPDRPPTLPEFRKLCLAAPAPTVVPRVSELAVLEAPIRPQRSDGVRLAAELARMREAAAARSPLQWAHDLQAREAAETPQTPASRRMTKFQRDAWREALAGPAADVAGGGFRPVAVDAWPPGMRAEHEARHSTSAGSLDAEAEYAAMGGPAA